MQSTAKSFPLIFLSCLFFIFSAPPPCFSASPDQAIQQMLNSGFNQSQANRLLANWSTAKHSLVKYAKIHKSDPAKMQVLAQICDNRFQAREDAVMGAVDDAIKAGYSRPIEAMVPTGGWKKALTMDAANNPYDYVLEAANADIDETFFGKMGATEYVTERASFRYAQRALGRELGTSKGDYQTVNRILTDGEVTWFPRDPQGRYSPQFEENFPSVVLESYQGREGQANLEVGYLINKKKGLADIVHYDKNGNIVRVIKNQPAESVINDLSKARYSTLQRLSKARQDYSHKYVDQVIKKGLSGDDRAEWAAKMLERMYGDEAAITGKSLGDNTMFTQAAAVKKIMRTVKNPGQRAAALKKVLGDQSLDDFVKAAEKEMKWMDFQNRQRAAWMLDDDLGKRVQGGRLNTVMKGLTVLSNGAIITDAYLTSYEGDRVNAISKALVTSLAADLAGATVGKVVGAQVGAGVAATVGQGAGVVAGGAAGIASGAVAGAIAAYVVNGTWEWTEEGANNMLRGYKGDNAVKKMFLNNESMIKKFVAMTPEEIKQHIEKEWEVYYQYSGAYIGKGTNDHSDIKQYMLEKAVEQQFLLKQGQLEGQIFASILRQELEELVRKMDEGKLTPEELDRLRAQFGKNAAAMVQNKLANDPQYAHFKKTLAGVERKGGKPGLWDRMKSNFDFRSEQEILDDLTARYDRILEIYDSLNGGLADHEAHISAFYTVLGQEEEADNTDLAGAFNDASLSLSELQRDLKSLQTNVDLFLADLAKSLGRLQDTTQFNYKKGEASVLLSQMIERVNAALARFSDLERIMNIKKRADDMLMRVKDSETADDQENADAPGDKNDPGEKDDLPSFVKKIKGPDEKEEDVPAFVKKSVGPDKGGDEAPAFVKKSGDEVADEHFREFDAAKDDYTIQSIALETVEVTQQNKAYEKVKNIEAVAVIIRIREADHIVDGYNALNLLLEKGFVYSVKGVGYVTSERFEKFMDGGPEAHDAEENGFSLKGVFGRITDGFKKDAQSESCQKARGCREQYGAFMDKPLSAAKDLPLKDYHAITACKNYDAQCAFEGSAGSKKYEIDECGSLQQCFGGRYAADLRDYNECDRRFGIESSFTRAEGVERKIPNGNYELDDFLGCKYTKEQMAAYKSYQKVIQKEGGIPKGMLCKPNNECYVPSADGKTFLPYTF